MSDLKDPVQDFEDVEECKPDGPCNPVPEAALPDSFTLTLYEYREDINPMVMEGVRAYSFDDDFFSYVTDECRGFISRLSVYRLVAEPVFDAK